MTPYIAEFVGTMILILLGDGVVANVNLNKSGMKGAGAVQITLAWGLAVLVPAFIFGAASGANVCVRSGQQNHQLRINSDHSSRCLSFDSHSQIHVKLVNP